MIQEPERRRRARLLSALLVPLVPLVLVLSTLVRVMTEPGLHLASDPAFAVALVTLVLLVGVYVLSRTLYYQQAAILLVIGSTLAAWAEVYVYGTIFDIHRILLFLVIPVLLSSMLLGLRATILVGTVNILGVLLVPVMFPSVDLLTSRETVLFMVLVALLTMIAASSRESDMAHIERQTRELGESEVQYRLLFEANPHPMWVYDLETLSFLAANDAAVDHYGYSRAEFLAMTIKDIRPPEDIPALKENLSKPLPRLEKPGMYRHWKKDGTIFWVEIISHELLFAGRHARLVLAFDCTERKLAEAALRQAHDELEHRVQERTAELSVANALLSRAARMKDEFLASVSHELRTPLNTILGMSEALEEEVYGRLSEEQLQAVGYIDDSGRHLLALINDLLDISKIESGKFTLDVGPVSIPSVCQASLQLIRQAAHKKELKIISEIDSQLSTIQADQRRLKQVLINLLGNAVKFTPEGGTIGLRVTGDFDRQAVHFTVWDTGIGIAREDMHRLFKPFAQLDSSLARHHPGTGLGLALAYRMVEMHGGSLSLESEVGKGSRFTASLPWRAWAEFETAPGWDGALLNPQDLNRAPSTVSPGAQQPVEHSHGSPVILLVEDNEDNIATVTGYLMAKGYRVPVARSGTEALARVREERLDVILMDIQMPGMDGLETTRYLRTDPALASIPIIALTALTMPGDYERCLEAGASDYLSKPVNLRRLVTAIERQISLSNAFVNQSV